MVKWKTFNDSYPVTGRTYLFLLRNGKYSVGKYTKRYRNFVAYCEIPSIPFDIAQKTDCTSTLKSFFYQDLAIDHQYSYIDDLEYAASFANKSKNYSNYSFAY